MEEKSFMVAGGGGNYPPQQQMIQQTPTAAERIIIQQESDNTAVWVAGVVVPLLIAGIGWWFQHKKNESKPELEREFTPQRRK